MGTPAAGEPVDDEKAAPTEWATRSRKGRRRGKSRAGVAHLDAHAARPAQRAHSDPPALPQVAVAQAVGHELAEHEAHVIEQVLRHVVILDRAARLGHGSRCRRKLDIGAGDSDSPGDPLAGYAHAEGRQPLSGVPVPARRQGSRPMTSDLFHDGEDDKPRGGFAVAGPFERAGALVLQLEGEFDLGDSAGLR